MWQICPICWAIISNDEADWEFNALPIHMASTHRASLDEHGQVVYDPAPPPPALHLRTRQAATTALAVGGQATVDITWSPEADMPSADYQVSVALAPDLAAQVTAEVVTQTAEGVQILLTAPSLAVPASSLHVTAIALTQES